MRTRKPPLEPICVGPDRAAELLDMSRDTFERRVAGSLKWVYVGRRKLTPVSDLYAWVDQNATRAIDP